MKKIGLVIVCLLGLGGLWSPLVNAGKDEEITQLYRVDDQVGQGEVAKSGKIAIVHYTGWLYDPATSDGKGKEFDSSLNRNRPFSFQIGAGKVIRGWDQGIVGMQVGGKRTLIIPAAMAYGSRGAPGAIPPNAALIFEIELLGLN